MDTKKTIKKQATKAWQVIVWMATIANVILILMLWTCCAITYLNPADHPRLSLVTLAFPVFLLANILCIPVWLIIKWKRLWLPLIGILACWSFIHDYFPLNLSSTPPKEGALKVLSFNSKAFGGNDANRDDGHNSVVEYLLNSNADIICLQESTIPSSKKEALIQQMEDNDYYSYDAVQQFVFTRLPILSSDTLQIPTRTNGGQKLLLDYNGDTILLINIHFESNHLSAELKNQYKDALRSAEADTLRKELKPMVGMLKTAAPYRAQQTDIVEEIIEEWLPRPVIVCGDFNDTPVSYTLRVLTQHLDNAYEQSGFGLGFTFHERGFPVRIDHILYSPSYFRSAASRIDHDMDYSDHYPIITYLIPLKQ
ncbi:MAG: endonuclease/exonuclease/phosphatase family protein [Bacteroidaceae bacterium]|nr:endonuclease/exonuclease/phosphatase family protein [Bacteroidaceae bacterium]